MDNWDATETAKHIANGDVTATEVIEAAIARLNTWNPKLNALTHFDPERALQAAKSPGTNVFAGVPRARCSTGSDLFPMDGV